MEEGFLYKEVFNKQFLENMASNILKSWGEFNTSSFINSIIPLLEFLSLSECFQQIYLELFNHFPKAYPESLNILMNSFRTDYMKANGKKAPKVFKLSKKSIPANGCFT